MPYYRMPTPLATPLLILRQLAEVEAGVIACAQQGVGATGLLLGKSCRIAVDGALVERHRVPRTAEERGGRLRPAGAGEQARAGGDELADDHVLFEPLQAILLGGDGGIGQDARRL